MQTFFQAYLESDIFGKLIFFSLFFLSCSCWILLIQKCFTFKKMSLSGKQFKALASIHKEELLKLTSNAHHPFSAVYHALKTQALSILEKNHYFSDGNQHYLSKADIDSLEAHLEITIAKLKETVEKNFFILSTTVTLAPFLGLLGTVWGILVSFSGLQGGQGMTSNAAVIGGLSTALTTTVLGLLIAIPALIGNNYLKTLSKNFMIEMVDFAHFLLSTIELQYRKVDLSS